jgi:hypothetical protein
LALFHRAVRTSLPVFWFEVGRRKKLARAHASIVTSSQNPIQ